VGVCVYGFINHICTSYNGYDSGIVKCNHFWLHCEMKPWGYIFGCNHF